MRGAPVMALSAVVVLFAAAGPARADRATDDEVRALRGISDRWSFSFGAYVKRFNSEAKKDDSILGPGTGISFEDDLQFDKDQSDFRFDGHVRFKRRHRLEFGYMFWRRENTVTLDEPVQFGGQFFDVDANLFARLDTDVAKLSYKYSFVNNGRVDTGFSAGLSTFVFETELSGDATVGGPGGTTTAFAREGKDVVAPVPLLGGHVNVTIHPRWFFRASAELFDVSVDHYDVRVFDWRASFDWYPFEHVGFGLGYNKVTIDYADEGTNAYRVDYDYAGIQAYLSVIFGGR